MQQAVVAVGIVITLSAAIIFFAEFHLHAISKQWRKKEKRVVITGLTGAGKTRLFQELTSLEPPKPTVSSVEKNEARLRISPGEGGGALSDVERQTLFGQTIVVDFPGHASDVHSLLQAELPRVAAVIFLVDSLDKERIAECGSYLFQILSSDAFQSRRPALCVVISKLDCPNARHKNLVRSSLEREIESLRRLHEDGVGVRSRGRSSWSWRILWGRKRRGRVSIMRDTSVFRILAADAPLTMVVQEPERAALVQRVVGFIQRSILLEERD